MNQVLDKADFTIPVEIEGQYQNIYVIKRPGVDQFMKRVGELYEVVVFTASVAKVCFKPKSNFFRVCVFVMKRLTFIISTAIPSWTSLISTTLSITGFSEIAATTTKATTSRFVDPSCRCVSLLRAKFFFYAGSLTSGPGTQRNNHY